MSLHFNHIYFTHDGALSALLEDASAHFPEGWTGIVGPNGAGKTTVLHLAAGLLQPQQGTVQRPQRIVFCPQRTDEAPSQLPQFISDLESEACVLRGKLQIEDDWAHRWQSLSHGERKRAQIGVALWQQPQVLLLDEPTNHIDLAARELLAEALNAFCGVGLLVSHDRDLLDLLCRQCLMLDSPHAEMRPGGYSEAAAEAGREEACLAAKRKVLKQDMERLAATSKHRHAEAGRSDRKSSKRGLASGDSDGRAKIDGVRVSGKDGQAGRLASQLKGRLKQARENLESLKIKKRYPLNFWLAGSTCPRQLLFAIQENSIALDTARRLHFPSLAMKRQDRIAITGANGMGKSTLVRYILDRLTLPAERLIYVPQEIDLEQTREIMSEVHNLPHEQLGVVMTVVSTLGSRPERLLRNLEASPGELRKVLLALGVTRCPYLIIMDEPTNHLDLPAIECLEEALAGCPCGLLLVSHDLRFLSRVADTRWHLEQEKNLVTVSVSSI